MLSDVWLPRYAHKQARKASLGCCLDLYSGPRMKVGIQGIRFDYLRN